MLPLRLGRRPVGTVEAGAPKRDLDDAVAFMTSGPRRERWGCGAGRRAVLLPVLVDGLHRDGLGQYARARCSAPPRVSCRAPCGLHPRAPSARAGPPGVARPFPVPPKLLPRNKNARLGTFVARGKRTWSFDSRGVSRKKKSDGRIDADTANPTFLIFSQTAATEENVKSSFRFESRILTRDVTVHSALSELTRRISRASWTEISLHLWKKTWEAVGDVRFAPGGRDAHDSCATPLAREPTEIPRVQVRSKTSARARRVFSRVRRAEVRFSALARVGFSRGKRLDGAVG